ncbi:MAG: restriction endonuclease subunit S [Spirochaetaceae bacterium]|nr:restriction endonuclease subunit S [Spirochaetaceae bacterium]
MSQWQKVKIGDICKIVKGTTGIASAEPGEYPLVVTAEERKTCSSYQFDCEAVCIPLVSSSGHGKKSLKNVHYQSGKFALGTILCAVIPNNPEQLEARFLHQYLQFYKDTILVPLMKGAANVSLSMKDIATVEIPLPPIENQRELSDKFITLQKNQKNLAAETEQQFEYIKLLRQNILQDAIEGKLTADWRKSHPVIKGNPDYDAEALFEKIQKEKDCFNIEKNIKNKNSSEIQKDEVSLSINKNWVWGRGEDCFNIRSAARIHQSDWKTTGVPFLRGRELVQLSKYGKVINPETYISESFYQELKEKFGIPSKNDILVSAVGTLGRVYIVKEDDKFYYKDAYILCFENYHKFNPNYFQIVISSPYYQKEIYKESKGTTVAQFTIGRAKNIPVPIPPLKEQEEIVTKVETLLAKVTELENQIQERKTLSEKLAFGIIKEKFEG